MISENVVRDNQDHFTLVSRQNDTDTHDDSWRKRRKRRRLSVHKACSIVAVVIAATISYSSSIVQSFQFSGFIYRQQPKQHHPIRIGSLPLFSSRDSNLKSSEATVTAPSSPATVPSPSPLTRHAPPTLYSNNNRNHRYSAPPKVEARNQQQFQYQQDKERQISSAGRQGRTDDALRLFYAITQPNERIPPTIRQLNAVIDACARARPVRLVTALEIMNAYTTATIVPNINNTTNIYHRPSTPPESTVRNTTNNNNIVTPSPSSSIRKLEPNVYTYGALMNAISRSGDIDLALQVLQQMQLPTSTVRPNVVVYQSAITAAANAARADISLQLLDDARKNRIDITVIGYNAAITAASRSNNYTLAIELLRRMQSDPTLPSPDSVTYGTVMAACEHGNQWQLVLQFAEEIENNTIASATITSDHSVVDNDKNRGDIYLDGMAITSALKACQQLGYASMAMYYLNRMKLLMNHNNTSADGTTQQSNSLAPTTSGRERIGSKQPLQGPDAVAYRLAISACARGGAWQDGIRLLNEYCQTVNDHDVVAYTAAITGCEYAGRWIEAVQLLIRMRQVANLQPNVVTFAAVIGACATACAQIMNDGATANKNNDTKAPNHPVDGEMPLPQKKALQILNVMKKDPKVVDPNIQVYNAAIRTCAEAMDLKCAFQVYQMIKDDSNGVQPNVITYGTLMLACERVGSIKGMDQVFTQMRNDQIRPNEIIYGTAISCCRKAGDKERAFTLLNKMCQDGYHPNVATINTVLIAQTENFKSGGVKSSNADLERAIQTFKHYFLSPAAAAAAAVTPTLPSRQSYSIMIRAFSSNQRPKDAEALLRRMRNVDGMIPDVDLYTITVSSYERIGQPLNALRLMESMREDGYDFYDVEVLNTLFKRLVKLVNAVGQTFGKSTAQSPMDITTSIM